MPQCGVSVDKSHHAAKISTAFCSDGLQAGHAQFNTTVSVPFASINLGNGVQWRGWHSKTHSHGNMVGTRFTTRYETPANQDSYDTNVQSKSFEQVQIAHNR
jgi:hypothetical protein